MSLEEVLEGVLDFFPIDINSTKEIGIKGLKPDTRVFEVNTNKSPLTAEYSDISTPYMGKSYIVDTVSGMKIACHPHIVGERLEKLSLDCAKEFIKVLKNINFLENSESLVVVNLLRAGPGYKVVEAIQELVSIKTIDIGAAYVKTGSGKGGFRAHEDERQVEILHTNYSGVMDSNIGKISTFIIPDTYASGKSAEIVINDLLNNLKLKRIILYGFITIPALIRLGKLASKSGIELISFAIGNITGLTHNNYDMPLYGVDESWYNESSEIKLMGSVVDKKTLERYLPFYIAGLDQPGDWSERQTRLFNGKDFESGDISKHLENSRKNIESLQKIYSRHFNKQPWYENFCKIASRQTFELNQILKSE